MRMLYSYVSARLQNLGIHIRLSSQPTTYQIHQSPIRPLVPYIVVRHHQAVTLLSLAFW